jgi:hypothetical protein
LDRADPPDFYFSWLTGFINLQWQQAAHILINIAGAAFPPVIIIITSLTEAPLWMAFDPEVISLITISPYQTPLAKFFLYI